MKPDLVFVVCGVASILAAIYLLTIGRPRRVAPAALWVLFGAGLLLQGFAPHLQIEHNAFKMPPELLAPTATIDPAAIVTRARYEQLLSALLTFVAGVGLAYCYRHVFFGAGAQRPTVASRDNH